MIRSHFKQPILFAAAAFAAISCLFGGETFSVFPTTPVTSGGCEPDREGTELLFAPSGETVNPGWALARLNNGGNPVSAPSFVYPETTTGVRVYLIDTAVDNSSGWFDGNPKLTIRETVTVHDLFESSGSSYFDHGSRMLSVIAGPGTGVALGTPIEVVNYDVYPGGLGGSTVSNLLVSAISRAIEDYEEDPSKPSVICIASSTSIPGSNLALSSYIQYAVQSGLPVVVSAGNSGADASGFVPAAYGTIDGVICVGASNTSNSRLGLSNFGPAVDLYAPGENVKTLRYPNPSAGATDLRNGTSYSGALVTAAALATYSMHPEYSPVELEQALKDSAFSGNELIAQLPPMDSDGDGIHDTIERFFGTDPLNAMVSPSLPVLTRNSVVSGVVNFTMGFAIDASRFNSGNPYTLSDGTTWRVLKSTNVKDWSPATGTLQIGTTTGNKTAVSFVTSSSANAYYLKIEIVAP